MPEIPTKKRNKRYNTLKSEKTKKIYFNDDDYYVLPENEMLTKNPGTIYRITFYEIYLEM